MKYSTWKWAANANITNFWMNLDEYKKFNIQLKKALEKQSKRIIF